jgi:tetratricopeptide (TPR) repeat protein
VTDFTRALEVNPLLVEAYIKRCMAYSHMDQQAQALADCTRALALDPRSEDAFHARAVAYARTGQYAQALTDTIQALKLNPRFFQGYYTQALLYEQIGRLQEAVEAYKGFLQTVPFPASPQYAEKIQQARQRVRDLGH